MDVSQLQEALKRLCDGGQFRVEDLTGEIHVDSRAVIVWQDSNNEEVEEDDKKKKYGSDAEGDVDDDVLKLSIWEMQNLISTKMRNLWVFKCENCKEYFNIKKNRKDGCWYHPGKTKHLHLLFPSMRSS